jgi:hypothetical protein
LLEECDSGSGGTSRDAATHQARRHDDLHYISSFLHLFKPVGLAEIFYIRFKSCESRAKICDLMTFSNYPEGSCISFGQMIVRLASGIGLVSEPFRGLPVGT